MIGTTTGGPEAPRTRRTQQERSAAMRQRLLEATVASLVEKGYGGTTTLEVQERAGVGRGGLLHHYSSRAELILAALEYLAGQRTATLMERTRRRPPRGDRVEWAVRTMWTTADDPLFVASLELWLAARHDPDLRAALLPLERSHGRVLLEWATELFGPAAAHPSFPAVFALLSDAVRGAGARAPLRSPSSDRRLISSWTELVKKLLDEQ